MVIDTSAIVAMLCNEPQTRRLEQALVADLVRLVPSTCVLEARMTLVSRFGEHVLAEIDLWLRKIGADVISVDADLIDVASQAWMTFGQGRHPASLNFADCISYALAKRADEPLLFIGKNFTQTDIEAA